MSENKGLKLPPFELKTPIDTIFFFGLNGFFLSVLLNAFGLIHGNLFILLGKGIWNCLVSLMLGQPW